jgi:hypothetical protein
MLARSMGIHGLDPSFADGAEVGLVGQPVVSRERKERAGKPGRTADLIPQVDEIARGRSNSKEAESEALSGDANASFFIEFQDLS